MFKHKQFRTVVIQPALELLDLYSSEAEELLIATCAIESYGGTYLIQSNAGPAKGVFQMEPKTHDDLWHRTLKHHPTLTARILKGCGYTQPPNADTLSINLLYAAMMARILYFTRSAHNLPAAHNIDALWVFYKQYWNTKSGKASKEQFMNAYYHFVGGHHP